MMDLNFHHLRYFWVTAREGGLTQAAKKMRVSPSTVSSQLRALEDTLERELFDRSGRRLLLTSHGEAVLKYADDIFALGQDLMDASRSTPSVRHPLRLRVGVADILPRLLAYQLLAPALHLDIPVRLVCRAASQQELLADLARHHIDVVIGDEPVSASHDLKATSHLLGTSGVSIFGTATLASQLGPDFPASLDGAPMLLPAAHIRQRRRVDRCFEELRVRPAVVGEFSDSGLLKAFGAEGAGLFPAPTVVRAHVEATYGVVGLGELPLVRERFYAIQLEGRADNQAVAALVDAAHSSLAHGE